MKPQQHRKRQAPISSTQRRMTMKLRWKLLMTWMGKTTDEEFKVYSCNQ
ncbi:hypothetical protein COLO4_24783 [Corchorus olitorius]|uniref:Uncharacterized protein n=1 Tax=Corchorus olitorius TaxID=93759 RepID=A0A1R3I6Y9_9ROSI|nr:hypothetical protein COLO4_24783 [Corchorus olitorius]